jgi:hypothetical protein
VPGPPGSVYVPLKTIGDWEVSIVPVHMAEPAVPLYVVPETRFPEMVKLCPLLSTPEPVTVPSAATVIIQVPMPLPLKVPEKLPASEPKMTVFNSFSAVMALTSEAPGLTAVTAVCSCTSVAVEKSSDRLAAAASSAAVIVKFPEEGGVVLMEMRNLAAATTDGVEVLAEALVACAQLTGVIMARGGALHTVIPPTVKVTSPPDGHENDPPDPVTPFCVPHEKLIPTTAASTKAPFTFAGARELDESQLATRAAKRHANATRVFRCIILPPRSVRPIGCGNEPSPRFKLGISPTRRPA